jgi:hypothetical protein
MPDAGPDVVGDARSDRARRRWPFAVLAVVIVLALIGKWADHRRRTDEFDQLIARASAAQATALDAGSKVLSTRQYTMPLLVTSSSATVRSGLEQLIDDSAATGAANLRKDRGALARVSIWPWHESLRAAKRAALAYLDQRISDLDAIAAGADLSLLNSAAAVSASVQATLALRSAAPTTADVSQVETTFAAS